MSFLTKSAIVAGTASAVTSGYIQYQRYKLSNLRAERTKIIHSMVTINLMQQASLYYDRSFMPVALKKGLAESKRFQEIEEQIDQHLLTKIEKALGILPRNNDFERSLNKMHLQPGEKEGLLFSPHSWNTYLDLISLSFEKEDLTLAEGMLNRSVYYLKCAEKNCSVALQQALEDLNTNNESQHTAIKSVAQQELDGYMHNPEVQKTIQSIEYVNKQLELYLKEGCFGNSLSEECVERYQQLLKTASKAASHFAELHAQLDVQKEVILNDTQKVLQEAHILKECESQIPVVEETEEEMDRQIIETGGKVCAAKAAEKFCSGLLNVVVTHQVILVTASIKKNEE